MMPRILFCLLFAIPAFADDELKTASREVLQDLVAKQKARERKYGDMRLVLLEESTDWQGNKLRRTIKFWSRENKYLRFDLLSDSGQSQRTIVRPEGYVRTTIAPR